ncbi:hypothetical protein L7F22_016419 [Adiantum nelumboides]|nr:hypothetical protein [Adiantum nelumboides]
MFRRLSFSSASLLNDKLCNLHDEQAQTVTPLSSLVMYSAVAKGTVVLSEYTQEGFTELPGIAVACLKIVPPLHTRFSYTTSQRRFICLLDGVATYCAITDEGLGKADAFSFLQKVRNAFRAFGKGCGMSLTLGAHFLDDEMTSVMYNLASSFIGIPQREKNCIQADPRSLCAAGADLDASSPSAVTPLDNMDDREFNLETEEGRLEARAPWLNFIGKARIGKKMIKKQAS